MDTDTLTPTVAAATLASAYAGSHNLGTDPTRVAVIKVWDTMMRGARKGFHDEHDVRLQSGADVGVARVAQFILAQTSSATACRS